MPQGNLRPDYAYASATLIAQVSPFYTANNGFGTPLRNGAGDYTMPVGPPGLPEDAVFGLACLGGSAAVGTIEVIGVFPALVTAIRVRTRDLSGVLQETGFSVSITKA